MAQLVDTTFPHLIVVQECRTVGILNEIRFNLVTFQTIVSLLDLDQDAEVIRSTQQEQWQWKVMIKVEVKF